MLVKLVCKYPSCISVRNQGLGLVWVDYLGLVVFVCLFVFHFTLNIWLPYSRKKKLFNAHVHGLHAFITPA